jgi:uncharacterized membrane protein YgcG
MQNRVCKFLVTLSFCLFVPTAWVFAAQPVAIPELNSSFIEDQTHTLNDTEREALITQLHGIQDSRQVQIAVFISEGLHGEPLTDFADRVAKSWRLREDGLLVLLFPSVNEAWIEVGYHLEYKIPEKRAYQWSNDLVSALKHKTLAGGLNQLLEDVEHALPRPPTEAETRNAIAHQYDNLLDRHPEYKLAFVLLVFSPLALFPMVFGLIGCLVTAPLFAVIFGFIAFDLTHSRTIAYVTAALAFPFPLLWTLNLAEESKLSIALQIGKAVGNLGIVALFFTVLSLLIGLGLPSEGIEDVWAVVPAGMFALSLAVFLFQGNIVNYLMIVLRSTMHFVFFFIFVYSVSQSLKHFIENPLELAFYAASAFTLCTAFALYLDSCEVARASQEQMSTTRLRWSTLFVALALLIGLPFWCIAWVLSKWGDETFQLLYAIGRGDLTTISWLVGIVLTFIAAVKLGLGRFFIKGFNLLLDVLGAIG